MKRVLIIFFVSIFFMSWEDSKKDGWPNYFSEAKAKAAAAAAAAVAAEEEMKIENQAIFDRNVASIRAFVQGFADKDLDAQMALFSDTAMWSPPQYNGNVWVDMEAMRETLAGYHDNFENITFEEGIDLGLNGERQPAFWSGSVYPSETATSLPNNIRIYGTWSSIHTESGNEVYNKWYGLMFFNEAGEIVRFTDWFDVNGMALQIAGE